MVLGPREHAPRCVKARESPGIYGKMIPQCPSLGNVRALGKSRQTVKACLARAQEATRRASCYPGHPMDAIQEPAGKPLFLHPQHPTNTASYGLSNYLHRLQSLFYPGRESMTSIGRPGTTGSVTRPPHPNTSSPSAVACVYKHDHKTRPSTCMISVRLEKRRRSLKATLSEPTYRLDSRVFCPSRGHKQLTVVMNPENYFSALLNMRRGTILVSSKHE